MERDKPSRVCEVMSECWQYQIRVKNREDDLREANLTQEHVAGLTVKDFVIAFEPKESVWDEVKGFIERHEWLGRMGLYPTHIFTARYKGILAGVVVLDMPNAFSKMLGEGTKKQERLISRGACISWSPPHLASALIMFGIRWAVANTQYRLFVAYSDPEAGEIGTIYQACNFHYLGAFFGARKQYQIPNGRWVSDRYFRSRSVYKRMAKVVGLEWEAAWQKKDQVLFALMSDEKKSIIKEASKNFMLSCPVRDIPRKGKYAYVLGATKSETRQLRKVFAVNCKTYPYPKRSDVDE